jgi:hypothetical protein
MDLKMIKSTLSQLAELASGWEKRGVDAIERDLALAMLRDVYAELRFGSQESETVAEMVVAVEPEPAEKQVTAPEPAVESEVPEKPLPESGHQPETEPQLVTEPESEAEVVVEPEPVVVPEPERPVMPHRTVDPAVIRTLYGSEPTTAKPEPQPEASKTYTEASKPTLGDVMNEGRQTLGEALATGRTDMASRIAATEATSLGSSIGLNDKFLMIRDMFEGSETAYKEAISRLDEFADLDEAIIYIHDTYNWSADSDGVKLLVELLERKLS